MRFLQKGESVGLAPRNYRKQKMSTTAYIALGSNLGDSKQNIRQACELLGQVEGVRVVRMSSITRTKPLGVTDQPDFYNCAAEIETDLDPQHLHKATSLVEHKLGRKRLRHWGPRTIDIDIIFFGDLVLHDRSLTIPHEQMHLRSFVLGPLFELCPKFIHPVLNETVSELHSRLNGFDFMPRSDIPKLVSVAGLIGVGKTTLTNSLTAKLNAARVHEPYSKNPFLPKVYEGKIDLALDSQLFFLVHRSEQLGRKALQSSALSISDYVFEKELIYARRTLSPDQLSLYESIYGNYVDQVIPPALVIYLKDSPAACLDRIHSRNRSYEQKIGLDFLAALDVDYNNLFRTWSRCPVIRLDAKRLFADNQAMINHLVQQINAYIL